MRRYGVVPHQEIMELIRQGHIHAENEIDVSSDKPQPQPSTLDLRLGKKAWVLKGGIDPAEGNLRDILEREALDTIDLQRDKSSTLLDAEGYVYVVELQEQLSLPPGFFARGSGTTTTARLHLLESILTDNGKRFNEVEKGYNGPLFLEIIPLSFPISIREGMRLTQSRFYYGNDRRCDQGDMEALHQKTPILYDETGKPIAVDKLSDFMDNDALMLSIDLKNSPAYTPRRNVRRPVDLSKVGGHKRSDYFDEISLEEDGGFMLWPGVFLVGRSRERVAIPQGYAAEMLSHDAGLGDFKVQEARFFNTGDGIDMNGNPAILEVKKYNRPRKIQHGTTMAKIAFYQLREDTDLMYGSKAGSSYTDRSEESMSEKHVPLVGKLFRE